MTGTILATTTPPPSLPVICWQTCPTGCHNTTAKKTSKQKRSKNIWDTNANALEQIPSKGPWKRYPLNWDEWVISNKVNRCLARYSPRQNHQPTAHQQGTKWASNGQKCQIRAKFGGFWAKNPNYYWRNQKFWDPHKGKPTQAPCSHWFLVRHWTKWAKNANISTGNENESESERKKWK